jgi:hypothetical protein
MLDDEYVYSLPTEDIQEAAFQLNRRTEFAVISKDYKSTGQAQGGKTPVIEVISDSTVVAVDFTLSPDGDIMTFSHINDFSVKTMINLEEPGSTLGEGLALDLLRKGAINRNNFEGDFEEIMIDGRLLDGSKLSLPKIRLGEKVVEDARVSISVEAGELFLLGEEIFSGFGESNIDSEKQQIIFN